MTQQEKFADVKIGILENEVKHIQEDIKEIKDKCTSIDEKLQQIQLHQTREVGFFDFVKDNYKVIILIFAIIKGVDFTGGQVIDLFAGNGGAKAQTTTEQGE